MGAPTGTRVGETQPAKPARGAFYAYYESAPPLPIWIMELARFHSTAMARASSCCGRAPVAGKGLQRTRSSRGRSQAARRGVISGAKKKGGKKKGGSELDKVLKKGGEGAERDPTRDPQVAMHSLYLLAEYSRKVGTSLLGEGMEVAKAACILYDAPMAVLSHEEGQSGEPIYSYDRDPLYTLVSATLRRELVSDAGTRTRRRRISLSWDMMRWWGCRARRARPRWSETSDQRHSPAPRRRVGPSTRGACE